MSGNMEVIFSTFTMGSYWSNAAVHCRSYSSLQVLRFTAGPAVHCRSRGSLLVLLQVLRFIAGPAAGPVVCIKSIVTILGMNCGFALTRLCWPTCISPNCSTLFLLVTCIQFDYTYAEVFYSISSYVWFLLQMRLCSAATVSQWQG